MKRKAFFCSILLGISMIFCGMVFAEEQPTQQEAQTYVYQTEDGVLSIQAPDAQWHVMSDPNYWFILSDGINTITVDHLANGEALPAPVVAGNESAAVYQAFISTKNEVFVIQGSSLKQESLEVILKMINSIKILKFDTKTAVSQNTAADAGFTVVPINQTYYCVSDGLNVRLGWSTDDDLAGSLTYGEAVTVVGSVSVNGNDTGWYQIKYNGSVAYVSAQYLSSTKPEGNTEQTADNDDSFVVYAKDGSSSRIHWTGGTMFEDSSGRTYSSNGDGSYYCITTDVTYAEVPDYWSDVEVNVEGDPYGDLVTGSDGPVEVNVEGDPYGDLVTGSDGPVEVNVEGDPYGDLVTGSDGPVEVNVEGDPYGDLVTGSDGPVEVNVEGDPYGDLVTGSDGPVEVNVEGDPYGDLVTGSDGN